MFLYDSAPPGSSGVDPAEEVRPCRAEGQAAHAETLRACPHSRSQESCTDPASGTHTTVFNVFQGFKVMVFVNS